MTRATLLLWAVGVTVSWSADNVWFEDQFATADGKPADFTGFKDFQVTAPLPHAKGAGGDYTYCAYAHGQKYDGYVLLGAKNGLGLIAKFARVQTVKTWRLADVPPSQILRFEMKGVVLGKPRRDEINAGFGLSDSAATVHHLKDANNIIWTFYRPRKEVGFIRPYVQWTGNRASQPTADINVPFSTNPAKPDDFVIDCNPGGGVITFRHNGEAVYEFADSKGLGELAEAPLAMVFNLTVDNVECIEIASWSLRLVDPAVK